MKGNEVIGEQRLCLKRARLPAATHYDVGGQAKNIPNTRITFRNAIPITWPSCLSTCSSLTTP
jgi:hypothetical protein